jgi:hypothetical protein
VEIKQEEKEESKINIGRERMKERYKKGINKGRTRKEKNGKERNCSI